MRRDITAITGGPLILKRRLTVAPGFIENDDGFYRSRSMRSDDPLRVRIACANSIMPFTIALTKFV
jgi:hypothetical protein